MREGTVLPISARFNGGILKPSAIAGFFVLVALLWTFLLQHVMAYPFVFLFLGAVMGSAWFGGVFAGLLAVLLSSILVAYFCIPPLYSFSVGKNQPFMTAFIASAIATIIVSSTRRRAEKAIREARDQLESQVQERTAELLHSNREILERERQLRQLTEAIPQQIWSSNAGGEIEYLNRDLLDFLGSTPEALRGEAFFDIFHPDDRAALKDRWHSARMAGEKFEMQARIRTAFGDYQWFLIRSTPQRTSSGEVVRWYGVHIEIEEQKRLEQDLALAHENLSRFSRTLSMAEMAAAIAHELNQPLTALIADAAACRRWLAAEPANLSRANAAATRIAEDTERASAVVKRVRSLFSASEQIRVLTDLNELIIDLTRLLREEAIRRNVSINLCLADDLPQIYIDPVQIQQLLLNLCNNAMDAMMDIPGERPLEISSELSEPDRVKVCVRDHGPGLPEDIKLRIFEPFFTTKQLGIGMGLAICRSIVEAHGGSIWTESSQSGATFLFTLRQSE